MTEEMKKNQEKIVKSLCKFFVVLWNFDFLKALKYWKKTNVTRVILTF